jgi:formylglycine-generating enzyme required for sulfatase activity
MNLLERRTFALFALLLAPTLHGCESGAHAAAPPEHRAAPRPAQSDGQLDQALPPADPPVRPCPRQSPEGMQCVLGGRYTRGTDDAEPNEGHAGSVYVSTFLMDTYEVTNAKYRECVAAHVCHPPPVRFPGYLADQQPALAMKWMDADAYCNWRGQRLPTEAEWERAASGPNDTRYPWGNTVEGDGCAQSVVMIGREYGCGTGVTWNVGSRAVGPWGLYDMSGNAWEWVADHYSPCLRGCRNECGDACFGENPRGRCGDPHSACPEARGLRIVRGGSWYFHIDRATVTARRGVPALNPNPHRFGFRCAKDLP